MIKRYHDDALRDFQKKALAEKGGGFQVAILQSALSKEGGDFVAWLEEEMHSVSSVGILMDGDEPPMPNLPPKYTPQSFKSPTKDEAEQIWNAWKDISPGILTSSAVWGYIVSRLIEQDRIKPYFLMLGNNGGDSDGRKEIDSALAMSDDKRNAAIDACVRAFLRRFSGLQVIRGTKSVYQDCPIAMTWWQYYIADDAVRNIGEETPTKDEIVRFLRQRHVWEILSERMASRLTVIGDRNIRDGLILHFLPSEESGKSGKDAINKVIKAIGIMCAWRALGYFAPAEVCKIIGEEIVPALQNAESGET